MKIDPLGEEIHLRDGRLLRLADADGMRIRCLNGTIWITSAGEPADILIEAGESYLICRNGLSLIESIGNGCIRLEKTGRGTTKGIGFGWYFKVIGALGLKLHAEASHG